MKIITLLCIASLLTPTFARSANPEDLLAQARAALAEGDWGEAIDLSEEATEAAPNSADAHFMLAQSIRVKMQSVSQARALFSIDDYTDALDRTLELDPQHIDAREERIGFLINAPGIAGGDIEEAERQIATLEAISAADAWEMRVMLAGAKEDPEARYAAAKKVVELRPEEIPGYLTLAFITMEQQRFDETEAALLKAQQSDEPAESLSALYQRGRWRVLASQDLQTAIELFETYVATPIPDGLSVPDHAAAYWRMGLAVEGMGDVARAHELVARSVDLNDDFEPAEDDLKRLSRALRN